MTEPTNCKCSKIFIFVQTLSGKNILPVDELDTCNENGIATLDVSKIISRNGYYYKLDSVIFDGKKVPTGITITPSPNGVDMTYNVKINNIPYAPTHQLYFYVQEGGKCKVTVKQYPGIYLSQGSTEITAGLSFNTYIVKHDSNVQHKGFKVIDLRTFKTYTVETQWVDVFQVMSDIEIEVLGETVAPLDCAEEKVIWSGKDIKESCEAFKIVSTPTEFTTNPVKKTNVMISYSPGMGYVFGHIVTSEQQNATFQTRQTWDNSSPSFASDWPEVKIKYEPVAGFECCEVTSTILLEQLPDLILNIKVHPSVTQGASPCTPSSGTRVCKPGERVSFAYSSISPVIRPMLIIRETETGKTVYSDTAGSGGMFGQIPLPLTYVLTMNKNYTVIVTLVGLNDESWAT